MLEERRAYALDDTAAYLFVYEHRINHRAAIFHTPVLDEPDKTGIDIDFREGCLEAVVARNTIPARVGMALHYHLRLEVWGQGIRTEVCDAPKLGEIELHFARTDVDDVVVAHIEHLPARLQYGGRDLENICPQRLSALQYRFAADAGAT